MSVTLSGQACTFRIYGKQIFVPYQPPNAIITQPPAYALDLPVFVEVYVNDALLIGSTLCSNAVTVVRNGYWNFVGDIAFLDTQGNDDPLTSGLGSRWVLGYWPGLTT